MVQATGIENPESLKELNAIEVTDTLKSFVSDLSNDVEEELTNRASWEQRIDRLRDLRYGRRRQKNHPWPKSANFNIPLMDTDIEESKPGYMNLINVSPVVNYVRYGAEDQEGARRKEKLNDWRLRTQVKFNEQYGYGVDRLLEQGATVMKVGWKFRTNRYTKQFDVNDFDEATKNALYDPRVDDELLFDIIQEEFDVNLDIQENFDEIQEAIEKFRNGETQFELEFLEVKEDHPQMVSRSLREDIVIPIDTVITDDNIDNARFIDDLIWTTKNEVKAAMRDETYIKFEDHEVEKWAGQGSQDLRVTVKRPQTTSELDDVILLHETCVWYDWNNDGIEERCIVTWPDSNPTDILRFIEMPYDHGQWPYTLIKREWNDPGVYSSRGYCALDEDMQIGISTEVNQTINNGTIVNNPVVVTKKGAVLNTRNNRYIPGNVVEVNTRVEDYDIRQSTNLSQPAKLQIAQFLKGWANQRISSSSSITSDSTNLPGIGQGGKKTKAEISATTIITGRATALDLAIYQWQMARVYYQIDALYDQFGSEEEFEFITGQEKVKISRRQIQGRYSMTPNGRLDNTNPAARSNKAATVFNMFNQDPFVKQLELRRYVFGEIDTALGDRLLKTAEDMQAEGQQGQAQVEEVTQRQTSRGLRLRKVLDMLEIDKEATLAEIQGKPHSKED